MAKRRALPALPSATTPLSSLSSSTALDPPDSDDEDNLDLPVIKLPGTPPIAEAEMETGGGGATGVPITPEAVTQRTKAKKIADTAVEGVASNKEGEASKRRSNRQSAGTGAQAGANEKKRSSRQSSDPKAKKVKTDGSCCGATVKEPKTVSKKTSKLKHPAHMKLCDLSALLFSFTQAVIFKPKGVKGYQEDPSHEEEAAIAQTSSVDR